MSFIIGCFANSSETYIVPWFPRRSTTLLTSSGSWMFKVSDEMFKFCADGAD